MILLILKIVFLFLTVWMGSINLASLRREGEEIPPMNFVIMAVGITGFVTIQWLL